VPPSCFRGARPARNLKYLRQLADLADIAIELGGVAIQGLNRFIAACACLAVVSLVGCLTDPWERALAEDTSAAYHHFMREHPGSKHRGDAQQHLEYHALLRRPTLAGFERFAADYPGSPLIEKLRPLVEEQAFAEARAAGTVQAYNDFMQDFPLGSLSRRAAGNAAYVEAGGFDGRPRDLQRFADLHPQSDFASEARRSAESVALRGRSRFDRVELVVDIPPEMPERERLGRKLVERAKDTYQRAGIQLVAAPELSSANAGGDRSVGRLTIRHSEGPESSSVSAGQVSSPGVVARTEILLEPRSGEDAVFWREFSVRVPAQDYIEGTSVLLASKPAELYWSDFFVPVASWNSRASTRPIVELPRKAVAVDAARNRVAVLFEDGSFQILELADPMAPVLLAEYTRTEKFDRYEGLRIRGRQVILFGPAGLEIVRLTPAGTEVVARWERGDVGAISSVEPMGDGLLVASSQGLLLVREGHATPERIMRRVVRGLAALSDTLVFSDGETVYITTLELLRERRILAQLRVGREFAPGRVRALGDKAVVLGERGVLVFDLSDPKQPRSLARLRYEQTGRVEDASLLDGRIALLGDRGIQLLDAHAQHVVESVDVKPRMRISRMDRHLVVVGGSELQVVDATPFTIWDPLPEPTAQSPASPN